MLQIQNKKFTYIPLAVFLAVSSLTILVFAQTAQAATMGQVLVRFDRMAAGTATTGTVCAQPSADDLSSTEAKVVVTFPDDYVLGAYTTFAVSTTDLGWPAGAAAWPGITAPAGAGDITGQAVTFASSDLSSSSTLYCFNWTNSAAVQQPPAPATDEIGSIVTKTSGDAEIDTGEFATATVDTGPDEDQIVVSATVPVAFAFELSGYTDALGNLSISSVASSPTPRTAKVNTNAKNGWVVWAKDANAGLTSGSASYTIPANTYSGLGPTTVTSGNEGYNTGVVFSGQTGGSGTVGVDPGFEAGGAGEGGGLTTTFHSIATSDGSAHDAILTLTNNVGIAGDTPAATDYTDTITIVGAGLF